MRAPPSTKGVVAITLGAVLLVTLPGQARGPVRGFFYGRGTGDIKDMLAQPHLRRS